MEFQQHLSETIVSDQTSEMKRPGRTGENANNNKWLSEGESPTYIVYGEKARLHPRLKISTLPRSRTINSEGGKRNRQYFACVFSQKLALDSSHLNRVAGPTNYTPSMRQNNKRDTTLGMSGNCLRQNVSEHKLMRLNSRLATRASKPMEERESVSSRKMAGDKVHYKVHVTSFSCLDQSMLSQASVDRNPVLPKRSTKRKYKRRHRRRMGNSIFSRNQGVHRNKGKPRKSGRALLQRGRKRHIMTRFPTRPSKRMLSARCRRKRRVVSTSKRLRTGEGGKLSTTAVQLSAVPLSVVRAKNLLRAFANTSAISAGISAARKLKTQLLNKFFMKNLSTCEGDPSTRSPREIPEDIATHVAKGEAKNASRTFGDDEPVVVPPITQPSRRGQRLSVTQAGGVKGRGSHSDVPSHLRRSRFPKENSRQKAGTQLVLDSADTTRSSANAHAEENAAVIVISETKIETKTTPGIKSDAKITPNPESEAKIRHKTRGETEIPWNTKSGAQSTPNTKSEATIIPPNKQKKARIVPVTKTQAAITHSVWKKAGIIHISKKVKVSSSGVCSKRGRGYSASTSAEDSVIVTRLAKSEASIKPTPGDSHRPTGLDESDLDTVSSRDSSCFIESLKETNRPSLRPDQKQPVLTQQDPTQPVSFQPDSTQATFSKLVLAQPDLTHGPLKEQNHVLGRPFEDSKIQQKKPANEPSVPYNKSGNESVLQLNRLSKKRSSLHNQSFKEPDTVQSKPLKEMTRDHVGQKILIEKISHSDLAMPPVGDLGLTALPSDIARIKDRAYNVYRETGSRATFPKDSIEVVRYRHVMTSEPAYWGENRWGGVKSEKNKHPRKTYNRRSASFGKVKSKKKGFPKKTFSHGCLNEREGSADPVVKRRTSRRRVRGGGHKKTLCGRENRSILSTASGIRRTTHQSPSRIRHSTHQGPSNIRHRTQQSLSNIRLRTHQSPSNIRHRTHHNLKSKSESKTHDTDSVDDLHADKDTTQKCHGSLLDKDQPKTSHQHADRSEQRSNRLQTERSSQRSYHHQEVKSDQSSNHQPVERLNHQLVERSNHQQVERSNHQQLEMSSQRSGHRQAERSLTISQGQSGRDKKKITSDSVGHKNRVAVTRCRGDSRKKFPSSKKRFRRRRGSRTLESAGLQFKVSNGKPKKRAVSSNKSEETASPPKCSRRQRPRCVPLYPREPMGSTRRHHCGCLVRRRRQKGGMLSSVPSPGSRHSFPTSAGVVTSGQATGVRITGRARPVESDTGRENNNGCNLLKDKQFGEPNFLLGEPTKKWRLLLVEDFKKSSTVQVKGLPKPYPLQRILQEKTNILDQEPSKESDIPQMKPDLKVPNFSQTDSSSGPSPLPQGEQSCSLTNSPPNKQQCRPLPTTNPWKDLNLPPEALVGEPRFLQREASKKRIFPTRKCTNVSDLEHNFPLKKKSRRRRRKKESEKKHALLLGNNGSSDHSGAAGKNSLPKDWGFGERDVSRGKEEEFNNEQILKEMLLEREKFGRCGAKNLGERYPMLLAKWIRNIEAHLVGKPCFGGWRKWGHFR